MIELERLLIEVSAINKRYEHISRITGENFNIFKTLGLQSSEVRLHSAFLAELLNAKGSHGQSDKYLKLFINQLKLSTESIILDNFKTISSNAVVEYHSGKITDDGELGGRIDILLTDENQKHIIIENKIYAGDQPKQLKRYKGFDNKAVLLYLNLSGNKPSDDSCEGLTQDKDYKIISYHSDILIWLETCMKESVTLPIIRETIHQYINLIKVLTNQTTFNEMNEEIKVIIKKNPDYFKNIPFIIQAYKDLISEITTKFIEKLNEKLSKGEYEMMVKENNEYSIQLQAGDGSEGFYLAFRLVKTGNNKKIYLKESDLVIQKNQPEIFNYYSSIFHNDIDKTLKQTSWSLAWYYPSAIDKGINLENLLINRFLPLQDENEINNFINKILTEADIYFSKLKEKVYGLSTLGLPGKNKE